jgi:hypothetical protein
MPGRRRAERPTKAEKAQKRCRVTAAPLSQISRPLALPRRPLVGGRASEGADQLGEVSDKIWPAPSRARHLHPDPLPCREARE